MLQNLFFKLVKEYKLCALKLFVLKPIDVFSRIAAKTTEVDISAFEGECGFEKPHPTMDC